MYDFEHGEEQQSGLEQRRALHRLEQAIAHHEAALASAGRQPGDVPLQVLRHSVELMRQERDRLRLLLVD